MDKKKILFVILFITSLIIIIAIDQQLTKDTHDPLIAVRDIRPFEKVTGEVVEINELKGIKINANPLIYSSFDKNKNNDAVIILKPLSNAYIDQSINIGDHIEAYTRVGTPQPLESPPVFSFSILIKKNKRIDTIAAFFNEDLVSSNQAYKLDIKNRDLADKYKNHSLLVKYKEATHFDDTLQIVKPIEIIILD